MENQQAIRYLHRHYVGWLLQGQWEPELSLPEGSYPVQGEWALMAWRFSEPIEPGRWETVEKIVEDSFIGTAEVWVVCRKEQVSALAMANTLSSAEKRALLWVAATSAAEEIQRVYGCATACRISEACLSYRELSNATLSDLNAWWTEHSAFSPQERREHRKRIQNYLKKGQFGHISGYAARCLKRDENRQATCWSWIPLAMESLWIQQHPPMAMLRLHLNVDALEREGADALVTWLRKTCAVMKASAKPDDPIERVTDSIRRDCSLPYSQANLAEGLGLTPAYFSRLFEKRTGTRFTEYLTQMRVLRAQELLQGNASLAEIARASGFQRKSYFCEVFRKHTGMTALQYRAEKGRGSGQ